MRYKCFNILLLEFFMNMRFIKKTNVTRGVIERQKMIYHDLNISNRLNHDDTYEKLHAAELVVVTSNF